MKIFNYEITIKKITEQPIKSIKQNHIQPHYFGYDSGYTNITICTTCCSIGMYEDQHPANCCSKCGGKVLTHGSAKWDLIDNVFQWIKKMDIVCACSSQKDNGYNICTNCGGEVNYADR